MKLIVKDPVRAKAALKTNRDIQVGYTMEGSYSELSVIYHQDPNAFENFSEQKAINKFGPKSNKKMKKGNKFKSKA